MKNPCVTHYFAIIRAANITPKFIDALFLGKKTVRTKINCMSKERKGAGQPPDGRITLNNGNTATFFKKLSCSGKSCGPSPNYYNFYTLI